MVCGVEDMIKNKLIAADEITPLTFSSDVRIVYFLLVNI